MRDKRTTVDLRGLAVEEPERRQHEPSLSVSYPGGGSVSSSSSASYDYGGQDFAAKIGDQLSEAGSQHTAALYNGDIAGALALGRRIADLRGYLDAYAESGGRGGEYDGVFGLVLPGVRTSSSSGNSSVSAPSGGSFGTGGRVLQFGD